LQANSVEDGHLNVAGGYLAVLLGHLYLSVENQSTLTVLKRPSTVQAIIACIDEFISHHRRVDDLFRGDYDVTPHIGLTNRLEILIEKLRDKIAA